MVDFMNISKPFLLKIMIEDLLKRVECNNPNFNSVKNMFLKSHFHKSSP